MEGYISIYLLFFIVIINTGRASGNFPFQTKSEANGFLRVAKRSTYDPVCEEYARNNGIESNCGHCASGLISMPTTEYHCEGVVYYQCQCANIDECASNPCANGGTCTDHVNGFTCTCIPGYTGSYCQFDIDECASSPCKNNATCHNLLNRYTCDCVDRFYGVNCDTNICHPTPADVVFVLDSSISMTDTQFNKQLEFIETFIDHVIIGPRDFQISVITYSFEAHIEFSLDRFANSSELKEAVRNITYKPGATFTDKGLEKAHKVFSGSAQVKRVNNTVADKFVFLLTDGMSTSRQDTKDKANTIKNNTHYVAKISVIGIGREVSHQELLDIASDPSLVYSVKDFDSLYTVLKNLVHYTCDECESSSMSDVAIFVDTSYRITNEQLDTCRDTLSYLFGLVDLHVNKTRVSMTSFDVSMTEIFGFDKHNDKDDMNVDINMIKRFEDKSVKLLDISDVLADIESTAFSMARTASKRIAIIFTSGNFDNKLQSEVDTIINQITHQNITLVCVVCGPGANLDAVHNIVNDAFDVYLTEDGMPMTNLDVLNSYFEYKTCHLHEE